VDTSAIGGCCDPEFQEWSLGLLRDFQSRTFLLLLSELTEAANLADAYLNHNILPHNFLNDDRHIAIATVAGADLVASWNFKHIVHFEKIQRFNAVNIEMGYKSILVFSPREVTTYGSKSS